VPDVVDLRADDRGAPAVRAEPDPTVPTYRYISADYAHKEWDTMWRRTWLFACREEYVAAPGDFQEFSVGSQSILVVRAEDGRLRAFHNACLHRGTRLKRGCGRARELRCMFHAWSWNLDGTNREIVDGHDFPGVTAADLTLPEVLVGTWGGFVFFNLDRDAGPLDAYLGDVPALFARFRLGEMRVQSHRQTIVPANWKVPIDNFNESYHVVGLHPQQLPFIDDTNVIYETLGLHSTELCRSGVPSQRLNGMLDEDDVLDGMLEARRSTYHQGNDQSRQAMHALEALTVPEGKRARDVILGMKRERLAGLGKDLTGLNESDLMDGHGLHLFPNSVMFMSYGECFIVRTRPNGRDPNTCVLDLINLDFPASVDRPRADIDVVEDYRDYDWGLVISQDFECFREVQIGLNSEALPSVRLARYQEMRIRNMHRNLEAYVGS
jgi:phenylpropionate dioxygenase-like ring-hydroxylating dioxygenase large terminal subunit